MPGMKKNLSQESTPVSKEPAKQKQAPVPQKKPNGNYTKLIVGCVIVAVVLIGVVVIYGVFKNKGEEQVATPSGNQTEVSQDSVNGGGGNPSVETSTSGEQSSDIVGTDAKPWLTQGEDQVDPGPTEPPLEGGAGIKDISQDSVKTNETPVGKDTFVSDLNGNNIVEKYDIKNIHTVTDFISYKKRRAVTGKGVELYWLEAVYKGVPAKVQVPFTIFKELDETGITVVDVEIVEVDQGDGQLHEVATNFVVRSDYKERLQNN